MGDVIQLRRAGRPPRPQSTACNCAMDLLVRIDEAFRSCGGQLWEAALLIGDYALLSECHALNGTHRAMRTQLRRIAGRADSLFRCADGIAAPGHGRGA
jgi:hypothetical protein